MDNFRALTIDDVRDCGGTVICRNAEDGIKALELMGPFDGLYLDNDMGMFSAQGYTVLDWLERPENRKYLPASLTIVTSNAAARDRMIQVARKLYNRDLGATFEEPITE